MRIVTPLLTQTYGTVRVPVLATLEQGTEILPGGSGAPSGYTDWTKLASILNAKLSRETDPHNQQVLQQAAAVAAAATPILGIGAILGAVVSGLALLGITIRGKTQHVDAPTSVAKATEFVRTNILPMWRSLPEDAREKLWTLTHDWDQYMWSTFKDWWGGRLTLDRVPLDIFPVEHYTGMSDAQMEYYLSGPEGYNVFAFYLAEMIHNADVETVNDNIITWFFKPFESRVLRPLDQYMLEKYNRSIAQYIPVVDPTTGKIVNPPPDKAKKEGLSTASMLGLAAGGIFVLGGLLSAAGGRRSRR